jgi:hypothetical protein
VACTYFTAHRSCRNFQESTHAASASQKPGGGRRAAGGARCAVRGVRVWTQSLVAVAQQGKPIVCCEVKFKTQDAVHRLSAAA